MARVIATDRGHDGASLREVGEEFDIPDDRLKDGSTWFVPVAKAPAPKTEEPNAQPPGAGPKKGSRAKPEPEGDLA